MDMRDISQENSLPSKSLPIALLIISALERSLVIVLLYAKIDGLFPSLSVIGKIAFEFVPPVLLLYYLRSAEVGERLLRISLVLVAVENLLFFFQPACPFVTDGALPSFWTWIINVSTFVVALVVFREIQKRKKRTLPWICLFEAIVILIYDGGCAIAYKNVWLFKDFLLWITLYIMAKNNLIPFVNHARDNSWSWLFVRTKRQLVRFMRICRDNKWPVIKRRLVDLMKWCRKIKWQTIKRQLVLFVNYCRDNKPVSPTEELRNLKTLFEAKQISEVEYKRRKTLILSSKPLSMSLLGVAALGIIVQWLPQGRDNDKFLAIETVLNAVVFLVPLGLLIRCLLADKKDPFLARCSLFLIAASGLLGSLKAFGLRAPIALFQMPYVPSVIDNVSVLIVTLLALVLTHKSKSQILPRLFLVEAIIMLTYGFFQIIVCFCTFGFHFILNAIVGKIGAFALWFALFVMTKYDLVCFTNNYKNDKLVSATEDLRNLKVLFETKQISEDEYKKRKAVILNIDNT